MSIVISLPKRSKVLYLKERTCVCSAGQGRLLLLSESWIFLVCRTCLREQDVSKIKAAPSWYSRCEMIASEMLEWMSGKMWIMGMCFSESCLLWGPSSPPSLNNKRKLRSRDQTLRNIWKAEAEEDDWAMTHLAVKGNKRRSTKIYKSWNFWEGNQHFVEVLKGSGTLNPEDITIGDYGESHPSVMHCIGTSKGPMAEPHSRQGPWCTQWLLVRAKRVMWDKMVWYNESTSGKS